MQPFQSCCLCTQKQGGRQDRRELFIPFDHMSAVLVSCVGIRVLCFLLIIQMFHSILSKKVHLMVFHIWKTTSFSTFSSRKQSGSSAKNDLRLQASRFLSVCFTIATTVLLVSALTAGIGVGATYRYMAFCLQILVTITNSDQLAFDPVLLLGASLTGLGRECLHHLVIFPNYQS